MKYFITGGAGFIGSNYVRGLLTDRWGKDVTKVTVFDAFTYAGNIKNLSSVIDDRRLTIVRGDVRKAQDIADTITDHDVVVHFAAESHVDRSVSSASIFIETNVLGTQNLLEESRKVGVSKFIHVSTDEVYGSIESGSWDESQPLLPNSPYAASKAASDLIVRSYFQTHHMPVCITRCSNNFGPYQFPEKIIPRFVTNLIEGKKIPLYGDGLNIRDWLHVDDHCRGIDLVVNLGEIGQIYNIGGGTELSNVELTAIILESMKINDEMIEWVQDRLGHDRRYSVDWTKIRTELGYVPELSLHSSIHQLIDWYRTNESWWQPLKERARVN